MKLATVEPPRMNRGGTAEPVDPKVVKAASDMLAAGQWVSDQETYPSESRARYQGRRLAAALDVPVTIRVWCPDEAGKTYQWAMKAKAAPEAAAA